MMKINFQSIILSLLIILFAGNLMAGGIPSITNSFNISPSPIMAGQEVVFSYTGNITNFSSGDECGDVTFVYNFTGGNLVAGNPVQVFNTAPFDVQDITVMYPAEGNYLVELTALQSSGSCNVFPVTAGGIASVLPAAPIPTLGQWALIILSICLVIFGVNAVRKSEISLKH